MSEQKNTPDLDRIKELKMLMAMLIAPEYGIDLKYLTEKDLNICALLGVTPYQKFTFRSGNDTSLDTCRINGDGILEWWSPDHGWMEAYGTAKLLCKAINGEAEIVPGVEE